MGVVEKVLKYKFEFRIEWCSGKWLEEGKKLDRILRDGLVEVLAAGFWYLWKNRNDACFRKKVGSVNSLVYKTLAELNNKEFNFAGSSILKSSVNIDVQRRPQNIAENDTGYADFSVLYDAAWEKDSSRTSIGFVVRKEDRKVILMGNIVVLLFIYVLVIDVVQYALVYLTTEH
ncbi:hypothetical protein Cni_G13532 [Canna indica]|uniref:Uncharacterized protein n=1 Tax=Canna indica TaxID=4628 RepID=A0AAQ3KAA0_9LILI|nr:hypothetical protein Cni_G13532 [Canna indica]